MLKDKVATKPSSSTFIQKQNKHSNRLVINFIIIVFLVALTCAFLATYKTGNIELDLHLNKEQTSELHMRNRRSAEVEEDNDLTNNLPIEEVNREINKQTEQNSNVKSKVVRMKKKLIKKSNEQQNIKPNKKLNKSKKKSSNRNSKKSLNKGNIKPSIKRQASLGTKTTRYKKKESINKNNNQAPASEEKEKEGPANDRNEESDDEDDDGSTEDKKDEFTEEKRLEYHSLVANQIFAENIEKNLIYLSTVPHLAGTEENNAYAQYVKQHFINCSLDNVMEKKYNVLLSYPQGPGNLTLFDKNGLETEKFSILEKKLDSFEKGTDHFLYPPFLAYSKSAEVEGEMVYANFGEEEDFRELKRMGVDVQGKIVLIRYGSISRNKKIKYAERYNVTGVILFSDPDTYSPTGVWYPNSWYLPPDGVQRGTLLRMRGDPLSRGYPAIKGLYQRPIDEVSYFPSIPVQPIGFGDAEKLLQTLDGLSPPNPKWHGQLNITYNVTSKDGRKVKLDVNVSRETKDITNVIGVIKGALEPDRVIILGNHRDAWTYGAADPSSGTAVMIEVARALGWLKEQGWQPRRTIMFCNWDAEEYGLLGSTEWTEEFAKILTHQAVAYINVDTAVQGNHTIELKSTPELVDTFFDAAKLFKDPDSEDNFYDVWVKKHRQDQEDTRMEPKVRMFREGSDYMPFYADLGIPAMDFRYMFNTKDMGVFNYPVYHTMHDNIEWMKKFVDPDFRYHTTIAKIWTQVVLLLADTQLLPFNFIRYSDSLHIRVRDMATLAKDKEIDNVCNFTILLDTIATLRNTTEEFHQRLQDLDKSDVLAVRIANDQMMMFERTFVTSEDLPGEPSTRHVYHTAGLSKSLDAVVRQKSSLEEIANKGYDYNQEAITKELSKTKVVREFQEKYSIYTYHVMMAVHSLRNPFTTVDEKEMQCGRNPKKCKEMQNNNNTIVETSETGGTKADGKQ